MGCCTSRPSPSDPADQPLSVAAQNAPASHSAAFARHDRAASHVSHTSMGRPGDPSLHSFSTRPNKPIRPPSPVLRCPPERALQPWTPTQLARERDAFFETRVTGDPAVWNAVRVICEMLRNGDVDGAQGMMDAVGLTCPTGRIKSDKIRGRDGERKKGGIFDEQGRGYDIPGWIVKDPDDLLPEPQAMEKLALDSVSDDEDDWTDDGEGGKKRRDEKGKGRAESVGDMVKVRARLSDRGSDVIVDIGTNQKVRALVKRISDQADGKKVKLMYLGKILAEDRSLADQGWQPGHVINALVFE
ncbi:hypothetical protein K461DRAFT_275122 [Myriangium duriaei CBS 260.36]|uniref:Ubiquitin-like domain-containing protein n=1 Tax=Myriangium duriaei CBS 260.36 TaxID=1168546 RepID=A0A9P4J6M6_9PEZI|nr:hypothetical protein K461DRAFT_275122 [Myriangium duriaei CBS 260.36]